MKGVIPLDGGELGYEERGQGPAVVLIHGGLTTSDLWDVELEHLADERRVVRYDLRGVGRSPSTSGRFSHHEDLRSLLDHLHVGRADVIGHSIGAAVAVDLAVTHPERVGSLVLIAPALAGYEPSRAEDRALLRRSLRAVDEAKETVDPVAEVEADLSAWLAGPYRSLEELDPQLVVLARELFRSARASSHTEGLNLVGPDPPAARRLGRLRAPTLAVVGSVDFPHVREVAEKLVGHRRRASLRSIERTAHFPMLERPEEFLGLLERFLEVP